MLKIRKSYSSGMSLIEVTVSVAILSIALAGLLSSLITFYRMHTDTKERTIAMQALRKKIEELEYESSTVNGFKGILAKYIANADFDVEGLKAAKDDPDKKPGKVFFPLNAEKQLMETSTFTEFGMPRDLNGDGIADSNVTTNYTLLPLTVRIEWESNIKKSLEIPILLTNKTP